MITPYSGFIVLASASEFIEIAKPLNPSGHKMDLLDNGHPAEVLNEQGTSPVLLVCEHASHHIPATLDNLGLDEGGLLAHFAWDIGAEAMARKMSEIMDATLVVQKYSRLVYDCNRPPEAPSAMPEMGENTPIPGNRNISETERKARIEQIYQLFHANVSQLLDQRNTKESVFVTVHSFTPIFMGKKRDVELGVLHDTDARLADAMLKLAPQDFITRRNEPYKPEDGVSHTTNLHADTRGLLNVMLEVRNDLISDPAGQDLWAERLSALVNRSLG